MGSIGDAFQVFGSCTTVFGFGLVYNRPYKHTQCSAVLTWIWPPPPPPPFRLSFTFDLHSYVYIESIHEVV